MSARRMVPWLLLVLGASVARTASAQEEDPVLTLRVHGFVSPGFIWTTDNNYLASSEDGSFEFSEAGLNFTMPISDRLRAGLQLFTRDLGPVGNYSAKFDWFYLDYRWEDWLGFRAGRTKIPFGLYNEVNDVDAARVPILLPQSVYPVTSRDYLLAVTGGELYGRLDLRAAGALDYRAYGGTIFLEIPVQPGSPYQVLDLGIPYVVGGRALWETPVEGLRAGGSVQGLRLETTILTPTAVVDVELPVVLWLASVEYAVEGLLVAAEYGRWHVEVESSDPTVFPEASVDSEHMYAMLAYTVNTWFQPGVYYSLSFPNVDDRAGRPHRQHDVAATLRFDISPYWLVKVEGHYMNGTPVLQPQLNGGAPDGSLTPTWAVFLAKTTVYF